jgi:hypothetical protein
VLDALRIANMLIAEAEEEAHNIRAEAYAVRDQATAEAANLREAAERDAAKVRASLDAMSAELNQVAASVTQRLRMPDWAETTTETDVVKPEPPTRALTGRTGRAAGEPVAKPETARQVSTPRPSGPPRQLKAAKTVVAAMATLLLFGVTSGTTEMFLHGFPFFVFRAAGTGATHDGLEEDQGPGQPDAPGTHHHIAPRHHQKDHHVRTGKQRAGGSTH